MSRILHVTEVMDGGVGAAIVEFARSTPQFEHHLLFQRRAGSEMAIRLDFAGWRDAGGGRLGRFDALRLGRALRIAVTSLRPDIVHLHSTLAGLVGRVVLPRVVLPGAVLSGAVLSGVVLPGAVLPGVVLPGVAGAGERPAVLFSPHCFGSERAGAGAVADMTRRLIRAGERAVAARADLAVCASPREVTLAAELGMATALVPNTTRALPLHAGHRRIEVPSQPRHHVDGPECLGEAVVAERSIVTAGRVRAQKDPRFLLRVKALLRDQHHHWTWIGGGDPALEAELRAAGVTVTGWVPAEQVQERLAGADVYLHTAAWESCPLPLLEAAAAGLPIVARSIPALDSLGLDPSLVTAGAVAGELSTVLSTGRPSQPRRQQAFAARHTPQAQVTALSAVYEGVLKREPVAAIEPRRPVEECADLDGATVEIG